MNTVQKNVDAIVAAIRAEELADFNMAETIKRTECGTSACILGFARLLFFPVPPGCGFMGTRHVDHESPEIQEMFGMDEFDLARMFFGRADGTDLDDIKAEHAIAALEDVKKGEFVNWSYYVAGPDEERIGDAT